jgi:signal transduction histidine kinase
MTGRQVPPRPVALATGIVTIAAVALLSVVVILGHQTWTPWVSADSVTVLACLLALACAVYAVVRRRGALRRAWLLLTTVILLNTVGGTLDLFHGGDTGPDALTLADSLYLLALLPQVAGLVLYPMAHGLRRTLGPLLLDGLVLGSSLLLLSDLLGLSQVSDTLQGADAFAFLVYPVTDVLTVTLVVVLLLRSSGRTRIDAVLLGLAFAAFDVADHGYAVSSVRSDMLSDVYPLGYVAAALLLGGAALAAATMDTVTPVLQRDLSGRIAPILPDLAAFAALGASVAAGVDGDVQLVLVVAVLSLTALRQLSRTAQNLRLRHDLEGRVAERTEELRQITEEHRRLDGMKQEFVSAVSHELRTPLTAIRGALEMLADGDAGELPVQAQPVVEMATRGSERLSRLVNQIIDLERLESGSFGFHPAAHDLHPLLLDAAESLAPLAQEARVTVQVLPVQARVVCDGDRVAQALVNLIGNALKFTQPGGAVTIEGVVTVEGVQISVRDTGRGIPQDELDAIFARFHQVEPDDARQNAGTGLGLSITQRIVEEHGGSIWVESTLGQGSTFHFTLPLDPAPEGLGVVAGLNGELVDEVVHRVA